MSFTDYYFKLGYQSTLEKVAAKKKKDDGGMSLAAKLGLGAAGLGAAGLGAAYGGQGMSSLGNWLADKTLSSAQMGPDPMQDPGIWGAISDALKSGGHSAEEYIGAPLRGAISSGAGWIGDQVGKARYAMGDTAGGASEATQADWNAEAMKAAAAAKQGTGAAEDLKPIAEKIQDRINNIKPLYVRLKEKWGN